ncbi:non-canonical purine NTP pyrophosphatase, rdgB/HAM1 family [Xylanimonas cellulosilytica DSM 15894]|uniref:dITP/XTP pyrophosphatase n=1 Tax=Xylanimonas cellulosilytica (strain DSM 15894 / JCM 12276 / CECT 5975 / KCTC 9989 / LMG 20990 / NBRC 107835 / XIL07) TaxID=446471 RepID=D1BZD8_XYLCX|nr:RdgB/HAM1 family non-canonical purine NTP pyrophosphatase [Xylanimonas cellulosilytica]ACZ30092.1 non-canonical purine NTP pyrophosphatase, rdgB/HAM1 family [Xylanimonas cellulosilytica DSM 15894]
MSVPAVEPVATPDGARLVLATHNRKKLVELIAILRSQPGLAELPDDAVVTAAELGVPEPVEDGVTFEENALIKARALARATGLAAVADDSGLAVDVLGGAPGIFSARWAGRHGDDQANLDLLLAQLGAISKPIHRRAGFVCAAALVTPDGDEEVRRGEMRGTLVDVPRGTNGFGYDPILVPDAQHPAVDGGPGNRTSAELSPEEKNAISHRGEAFRALAPAIAEALQER